MRQRPRLRGVLHERAAFAAAGAGAVLVASAATSRAMGATAVYAMTLVLMFAVSAAYHRVHWSAPALLWMRRLDHAAIFLVIAGTYTPLVELTLGGAARDRLLVTVWSGAALGVAQALVWPRAPRAVAVALYCGLGWVALVEPTAIAAAVGWGGVALLVAGGLMFTGGAVVYALRRPDPFPRTFGYHEIFHALVIVAAACHFVLIALLLHEAA